MNLKMLRVLMSAKEFEMATPKKILRFYTLDYLTVTSNSDKIKVKRNQNQVLVNFGEIILSPICLSFCNCFRGVCIVIIVQIQFVFLIFLFPFLI